MGGAVGYGRGEGRMEEISWERKGDGWGYVEKREEK